VCAVCGRSVEDMGLPSCRGVYLYLFPSALSSLFRLAGRNRHLFLPGELPVPTLGK
jgi:hypothetical protein